MYMQYYSIDALYRLEAYMVYMGSQKSSADHFLGVVFNEETHGDLCFSPFGRPDTVMKLQSQTARITCPPPLYVVSAAAAKNRARNASEGPERRPLHAPTTVGGTADGTRRSTVGTLNMGTWAETGEALAWYIASDVPSTSPSHGSNSGAHRESYSTHTYAFKRSCAYDSCNTSHMHMNV